MRENKRVRKNYLMRFRVRPDTNKGIHPSGWDAVVIQDISNKGVLFKFNKNLAKGTLLDLEIRIPVNPKGIVCQGEIIRTEEQKNSSILKIAMKFVGMSDENKKQIEELIHRFHET